MSWFPLTRRWRNDHGILLPTHDDPGGAERYATWLRLPLLRLHGVARREGAAMTPTLGEVARVMGGLAIMFARAPLATTHKLVRELRKEFAATPQRGTE